jgi:hypothetical protein
MQDAVVVTNEDAFQNAVYAGRVGDMESGLPDLPRQVEDQVVEGRLAGRDRTGERQ